MAAALRNIATLCSHSFKPIACHLPGIPIHHLMLSVPRVPTFLPQPGHPNVHLQTPTQGLWTNRAYWYVQAFQMFATLLMILHCKASNSRCPAKLATAQCTQGSPTAPISGAVSTTSGNGDAADLLISGNILQPCPSKVSDENMPLNH